MQESYRNLNQIKNLILKTNSFKELSKKLDDFGVESDNQNQQETILKTQRLWYSVEKEHERSKNFCNPHELPYTEVKKANRVYKIHGIVHDYAHFSPSKDSSEITLPDLLLEDNYYYRALPYVNEQIREWEKRKEHYLYEEGFDQVFDIDHGKNMKDISDATKIFEQYSGFGSSSFLFIDFSEEYNGPQNSDNMLRYW